MSKIISTTITNPNGKEDTCALVQVTGQELYYLLRPIEIIGRYTISFWVKAQASETIVVRYGEQTKEVSVNIEWQRVIFSFNAEHIDNVMIQFTTGNYYVYNTKLESGNFATDYSESPEDIEKQLAQIEASMNTKYSEVMQTINSFVVIVGETYSTKNEVQKVEAKLELKVGVDENDKIVSMINASADEINLKTNRLSIESDNFTLTKDGTMKSIAGEVGGWEISESNIHRAFEEEIASEILTYETYLSNYLEFKGTYPEYIDGIAENKESKAYIRYDLTKKIYQSQYNPTFAGLRIYSDEDVYVQSLNGNIDFYLGTSSVAKLEKETGAFVASDCRTISGASLNDLYNTALKLVANTTLLGTTINVSPGDILILSGYGSGAQTAKVYVYSSTQFIYEYDSIISTLVSSASITFPGALTLSISISDGVLTVAKPAVWSGVNYMHYHVG